MTAPAEADGPHWWALFRRVVVFLLGVVVVLDSLGATSTGRDIGELIVGVVMVGLLPLDDLFNAVGRRRPRREE